ncbi:MAG: ribonuclease R [Bacilli bacterium]|jgi:ribonuclease R|nr:ribonuclease R [Bacilli bacterium]
MTEKDLTSLLKGQTLTLDAIRLKLEAVTTQAKTELDNLLAHLEYQGVVGIHDQTYYLLEDQDIVLAKVALKKRNFVVLDAIPGGYEIKISGEEADGLLLGDLLYLKEAQGLYHAIDYLKPVDSFKGRYSLTANGKEQLLVDYLNQCGKTVLISSVDKAIRKEINQGDLVLGKIQSYVNHTYTVEITKILVKADSVGSDISMIISSNDAPLEFPEAVVEEAKSMPTELKAEDYQDRSDFRDETVVTIDGTDSHDFDDAVSIRALGKGYEVMVHIADVTHYVLPNHPLDNEAIYRGTSIYVADRVVPMLPFELSNGICSLNPDVDRLTLTCIMDLDTLGNVFSSKVVQSVIKSHGRLTYDQVNQFFAGKAVDLSDEIKKTLTLLHTCSQQIRARRERQGAMKLSSTELKFKLDENGQPTDVVKEVQGEGEKMIEDLMIIANCEIAKLLKSHHVPVLYRVHENPPTEKLIQLKDFIKKMNPKLLASFPKTNDISGVRLNDFLASIPDTNLRDVLSYMMLRAMAKAKYSPEELGHFGLAEPYYCHFTSPIRRYPDDIIHRLVRDYLIQNKVCDEDAVYAYLDDMGDKTSAAEVRADCVEREVDDLESSKYMTQHIGEVYHGKITGIVQRGVFVETELGIEGFLAFHCMHGDVFFFDDRSYSVMGKHHPELSFTIGTPIDVAVLAANPKKEEIDFATPEFYTANAVDLSEEDREDLSLNGLKVYDEDEDFRPMTSHPRFREDDRGDYRSHDDRGDYRSHDDRGSYRSHDDRGDYRSHDDDRGPSRYGDEHRDFHRSDRNDSYRGGRSFRRDDSRGSSRFNDRPADTGSFDSQAKPVSEEDSFDRKPKRPTYADHQGYSAVKSHDNDGERRSSYGQDRGNRYSHSDYGHRDEDRSSYSHEGRSDDRRSDYRSRDDRGPSRYGDERRDYHRSDRNSSYRGGGSYHRDDRRSGRRNFHKSSDDGNKDN